MTHPTGPGVRSRMTDHSSHFLRFFALGYAPDGALALAAPYPRPSTSGGLFADEKLLCEHSISSALRSAHQDKRRTSNCGGRTTPAPGARYFVHEAMPFT